MPDEFDQDFIDAVQYMVNKLQRAVDYVAEVDSIPPEKMDRVRNVFVGLRDKMIYIAYECGVEIE
jgi:hypothetical protein